MRLADLPLGGGLLQLKLRDPRGLVDDVATTKEELEAQFKLKPGHARVVFHSLPARKKQQDDAIRSKNHREASRSIKNQQEHEPSITSKGHRESPKTSENHQEAARRSMNPQ